MNNQKSVKAKQQVVLREMDFAKTALIVIIAILVLAAILRLLTPTPPSLPASDFVFTNYDDTRTTFKKISFIGSLITPPEEFMTYQVGGEVGLANTVANSIIAKYSLTPEVGVPNYWSGENAHLAYSPIDKRYSFSINSPNNHDSPMIVLSEAIRSCLNFYNQYQINLSLSAQTQDILHLSEKHVHGEVSPEEADVIQIPFTIKLGDQVLLEQNELNTAIVCRVNRDYEVIKMVFKETIQSFVSAQQLKSISLNQALANIERGNASIIDAYSEVVNNIDLNWIEKADLYDVKIEYRFDPKLGIAYPFYRFSAKLTNSAGVNIQAEIITPAVNAKIEK